MAGFVGGIVGAALLLLLMFILVLAIGKLPRLRSYRLAVYLVAAVLVWVVSISGHDTAAVIGAYLVSLVAIWDYRRGLKKPPNGWYRLGAGFTVLWLILGVFLLRASEPSGASDDSMLVGAWAFAAIGMLPWLVGWLTAWIRLGFKTQRA